LRSRFQGLSASIYMKINLIIALFFASLLWPALSPCFQSGQWKEYVYRRDGFAITTPSKPKFQQRVGSDDHWYIIGPAGEASHFTLTVSSPPRTFSKEEMESAKKYFQELVKDILVPDSFKEISLSGYPGFQYELRFRQTSRIFRAYMISGRYFLLSVPSSSFPDGERILDSFRLLAQK
jgi:hypothetical protein